MNRLIVSLTSFPARIDSVKTVLDSLYRQTLQADEIILWLAEEQFPNKETDLPLSLQEDLAAKRFTLRWCDDLGCHKRYFYVMQEYPEDNIVTVDDDLYYHPDSLEKLMEAHKRYPNAVVALTTYLVSLDKNLQPLPVLSWLFDFQQMHEPSMLLLAGPGGGALFPPHSIDERIFDKQLIYDTCSGYGRIYADHILLKAGCMLKHTPVLAVPSKPYYRLPDTQDTALRKILPSEEHINQVIKEISEHFRDEFDTADRLRLQEAITALKQSEQYSANFKKYLLQRPLRELERQLGYLSLPDAPPRPNSYDYSVIKDIARIAARVFTVYPADISDEETQLAFRTFRQQLENIPNIDSLADSDAIVCGFVKYGVALNTECRIIYYGVPLYMQSLKNWQSFMSANPECEPILRKGYEDFLADTKFQIGRANSILSKAEIYEWMLAYADALNDYKKLQMKISRE